MKNMLIKLDEYSPKKEKYKTLKTSAILNARDFTKEENWLLMLLKMVYFHCLNNLQQTWAIGKKIK